MGSEPANSPYIIRLDKGVLLPSSSEELWEGCHEPFDPDPRHLDELTRHHEFPGTSAYGDRENHLEEEWDWVRELAEVLFC